MLNSDKHLDSNPQTMHILMLRATSASYQKDDRQFKIHHARYITNYSPPTEQKSEDQNDTSGSLHFADTEKSFLIVNAL